MCTVEPTLIPSYAHRKIAVTSILLLQRVLARDGGGDVAADGGGGRGLRGRSASHDHPPPAQAQKEVDEVGE